MTVALAPDQFALLVRIVAREVAQRLAPGRASFSVAEIALRNNVSARLVYREIAEGRLAVIRPGGGATVRVTPKAEELWLHGQVQWSDEPVFGVDPVVSARNRAKRLGRP
jgi:hypothetical protein